MFVISPEMIRAAQPGNCYESAFLALYANPKAILVHGKPRHAHIYHAWCELWDEATFTTWVYNGPTMSVLPKAFYYEAGKIVAAECVRYTRELAIEKVLLYEHYGRWHDPYGEDKVPGPGIKPARKPRKPHAPQA